jgi:hypothetical protein
MTVRGRNADIVKLVRAPILALVAPSLLLPSCVSFTPCPAPRFDDFCEALVGKWGYLRRDSTIDSGGARNYTQSDGIDCEDALAIGTVEEVMRSCGGAVQGVRETDGTYLNRADDGFVYFPDGSYSSGPTTLDGEQISPSGSQEIQFTTSCLSFATTRFLFKTPLQVDNTGADGRTCSKDPEVLVKFRWSDTPTDVSRSIGMAMRQIAHEPGSDTSIGPGPGGWQSCGHRVTREVQCRMPTRGQNWMLPRALWEQRVAESTTSGDASGDDDSKEPTNRSSTQSSYWVDLMLGDSGYAKVRNVDDLVQSSSAKEQGHGCVNVLQVRVEVQGTVKVLSRIYHPQGGLEKVVWTEGISISM